MSEHFADRLLGAVEAKQSQVVVGLDPRPELLPPALAPESLAGEGSARRAAEAIVEFNRGVLEAVCEVAAAVKVQVAFYERFGCEGMRAYAETLRGADAMGLIVIGDVKRGDIGTTAEAYAAAHLPGEGGAEFAADAVTVNPLFGSDGVAPFVKRASRAGCGVFALVKTSNPSSTEIQDLCADGRAIYEHIAGLVDQWGRPYRGARGYSLLGAVVGATFPKQLARLRALMPHTPLLVPGVGAQGAGVEDVLSAFDQQGLGAVVNSSRGIIFAFRREPYRGRFGPRKWKDAVRAAAEDLRRELWLATHPSL